MDAAPGSTRCSPLRLAGRLVVVFALTVLAYWAVRTGCQRGTVGHVELGRTCLDATRLAIEREIRRHEAWLAAPEDPNAPTEPAEQLHKRLGLLRANLQQCRTMRPEDQPPPRPLTLTARVAAGEGGAQMLVCPGPPQPGPVCEVVGSRAPLRTGATYRLTAYPLWPRWDADEPGFYVYVQECAEEAGH